MLQRANILTLDEKGGAVGVMYWGGCNWKEGDKGEPTSVFATFTGLNICFFLRSLTEISI